MSAEWLRGTVTYNHWGGGGCGQGGVSYSHGLRQEVRVGQLQPWAKTEEQVWGRFCFSSITACIHATWGCGVE